MSPLKRLQPNRSLTEQARQSIKQFILSQNPGADVRLTETFFAERLGISKSPVREALNSLQSDGLLRIEPRRGAYVPQFSGKEIADLYQLREALETYAAIAAPLSDELIAELRASVARTELLLADRRKQAYIEEDIYFHSRIVAAVGNAQLTDVHDKLQDKLWLCRCQTFQLTSSDTPGAHRAITEALAAGDRGIAARQTSEHIHFVRQALLNAWTRLRSQDEAAAIAL